MPVPPFTFIAPRGCGAHRLAHLLDSLVRVSRRVDGQAPAGAMSLQFFTSSDRPQHTRLGRGATQPRDLQPRVPAPASARVGLPPPRVGITRPQHARPSLPTVQFHALFHSLASGLFIVPSRYFFAIGLPPVFSLRWGLPPNWGCIPKQPDSPWALREGLCSAYGTLTLYGDLFQDASAARHPGAATADYNSPASW